MTRWQRGLALSGGFTRTVEFGESPFVDRDEELALLEELFAQTLNRKGQVVFLSGEGGVGKTRLMRELGSRARRNGAVFAVGTSYEGEGMIPYGPWVEAIRSVVSQSPSGALGKSISQMAVEVGKIVPELAGQAKGLGIKGWLSGPGPMYGMISGEDVERARLFQSVTDFLVHFSNERPLLLFFDDAVWADAASLQLLHYFCRRVRDQRVMVVAAYREVELPEEHPLSKMLVDLSRGGVSRKIVLKRLSTHDVAELLSNRLGGGAVASDFTKLIHSRTGGNPFFVEEVLRSLSEDSRIYRSAEGWSIKEIGQVEIPLTVRALIKQRVSRLGENGVQILTSASAVGMEFSYELLKRAVGQPDEVLINELERAAKAGLVKEKRVGSEVYFLFADEQVRDFLYEELSIVRKRKVHGKVALAMEQLYERSRSQHVEELASHYVQGGEVAKAVEYSIMAGDRAARVYAHPEAKRHFVNALDLMEEDRLKDRLEILTKLGDSSMLRDTYEECIKYYGEAVRVAGELKENRALARLYAKMGTVTWYEPLVYQKALEYFHDGLKALEGEGDSRERAAISQEVARLLIVTGEANEGLQWCRKAIDEAKKLGDNEVLAHAYQTLALGLQPDSEGKERIFANLEESERISAKQGFGEVLARGYDNLAMAYSTIRGDYRRAEEYGLKAVASASKIGFRNYESYVEAGLSLYGYLPLGKWDMALEAADHSLQIASEAEILNTSKAHVVIGLVSLFRGNLSRAEEHLKTASSLADKSRLIERVYPSRWALGKLYLKKGDLEGAEEELLAGLESGSRWGWSSPTLEVSMELVRVYCLKGKLDKTQESYERVRREASRLDEKWGYAYEAWALGLLALAQKKLNLASEAFRKSSKLWNELNHPYNFAQTTLGLSLALEKDAREAGKWREEAAKVLTSLGASLEPQGVTR